MNMQATDAMSVPAAQCLFIVKNRTEAPLAPEARLHQVNGAVVDAAYTAAAAHRIVVSPATQSFAT